MLLFTLFKYSTRAFIMRLLLTVRKEISSTECPCNESGRHVSKKSYSNSYSGSSFLAQPTFTYSKSTIAVPDKGLKYVQS